MYEGPHTPTTSPSHHHHPIPPAIPVAQQYGSTTHSEQAVGNQHGPLITKVPILCDVLSAHHQTPRIGVHLQQLTCKRNGDHTCAAPHTPKVVRVDIGTHFKVVNNHGGQRGGGVEEGAVDDENVDLLGFEFVCLEEVVYTGEDDFLCF